MTPPVSRIDKNPYRETREAQKISAVAKERVSVVWKRTPKTNVGTLIRVLNTCDVYVA